MSFFFLVNTFFYHFTFPGFPFILILWKIETHKEELNSFYRSPNLVRVIKSKGLRWAGHVDNGIAFEVLTGKPTRKRPLGTPRRRWEDNIRIDLEEIGIKEGN